MKHFKWLDFDRDSFTGLNQFEDVQYFVSTLAIICKQMLNKSKFYIFSWFYTFY